MRARTCRSLIALGGALGLVVSIFSALEFYDASLTAVCTVNGFISCSKVANSGLTMTFGVQDYLWGMLGFVVILVLAALSERRRQDNRITYLLLLITSAGVAFSVYFLYVELVQIGALCLVCLSAYLCGVAAWIGAIGLSQRAYRRSRPAAPEPSAEA